MKNKPAEGKNLRLYFLWHGIVSLILVSVGLVFAIWGFGIFPEQILPRSILLSWESSIYGSALIGWGTMVFLLGRLAWRRKDPELMKIMLIGIGIWLAIEAFFSACLGVFFNVGVDFAVFLLFGIPTMRIIHDLRHTSDSNEKTGELHQP